MEWHLACTPISSCRQTCPASSILAKRRDSRWCPLAKRRQATSALPARPVFSCAYLKQTAPIQEPGGSGERRMICDFLRGAAASWRNGWKKNEVPGLVARSLGNRYWHAAGGLRLSPGGPWPG